MNSNWKDTKKRPPTFNETADCEGSEVDLLRSKRIIINRFSINFHCITAISWATLVKRHALLIQLSHFQSQFPAFLSTLHFRWLFDMIWILLSCSLNFLCTLLLHRITDTTPAYAFFLSNPSNIRECKMYECLSETTTEHHRAKV